MVPDALADVVADLFNLVLVQIWQSSLRHYGRLIQQRMSLRRLALLMINLIVGLGQRLILLLDQCAVIALIRVRLLRLIINRLPKGCWRGLLLILCL